MLESFPGELCAFYIMDIDDFKHINDAFGHYAGDDLLCDVAVTLEEVASAAGGFSGRLGGDEFALFIPIVDRRRMCISLLMIYSPDSPPSTAVFRTLCPWE